jgi:hypothetical protein
MDLVFEFTFRADFADTHFIGTTPVGNRFVGGVGGGWVKGERIRGVVLPPGGDWMTLGTDGFARADVRLQLRTDDGVTIGMQYTGLVDMTKIQPVMMSGQEGSYDDGYWRTAIRFDCSDDRYAWLNTSMFIARGRAVPGAVEYEVFRLT